MRRHTDARLENLYRRHPYCFWCGRKVYKFLLPDGKRQPDNFATLDHLNSRVGYPDGRPLQGFTVLACRACNQDRAVAEEAGVYWLPPLMASRRATAARSAPLAVVIFAADLRAFVASRPPGGLFTTADAAEALAVREIDADFALRQYAAGFAGGTGLTRRDSGWVYSPPGKE